MQDYLFWTRPEIIEGIKTVELAEMSGLSAGSTAGANSASWRSLGELAIVKRRLTRALERVDGRYYGSGTRPRHVSVNFRNGYDSGPRVSGRNPFGC